MKVSKKDVFSFFMFFFILVGCSSFLDENIDNIIKILKSPLVVLFLVLVSLLLTFLSSKYFLKKTLPKDQWSGDYKKE
jgi:uncharacterized membrane protein YwzB